MRIKVIEDQDFCCCSLRLAGASHIDPGAVNAQPQDLRSSPRDWGSRTALHGALRGSYHDFPPPKKRSAPAPGAGTGETRPRRRQGAPLWHVPADRAQGHGAACTRVTSTHPAPRGSWAPGARSSLHQRWRHRHPRATAEPRSRRLRAMPAPPHTERVGMHQEHQNATKSAQLLGSKGGLLCPAESPL